MNNSFHYCIAWMKSSDEGDAPVMVAPLTRDAYGIDLSPKNDSEALSIARLATVESASANTSMHMMVATACDWVGVFASPTPVPDIDLDADGGYHARDDMAVDKIAQHFQTARLVSKIDGIPMLLPFDPDDVIPFDGEQWPKDGAYDQWCLQSVAKAEERQRELEGFDSDRFFHLWQEHAITLQTAFGALAEAKTQQVRESGLSLAEHMEMVIEGEEPEGDTPPEVTIATHRLRYLMNAAGDKMRADFMHAATQAPRYVQDVLSPEKIEEMFQQLERMLEEKDGQ